MVTLPPLALDHLAIAAGRLGEGIDFVEEMLGVRMPLGGKHPLMNTHNAVMKLGDRLYLEVIAVDPEAGPPVRPRWFGLDSAATRARLAAEGPRLIAWLVRTDDIAASLAAGGPELGQPLAMSRGDLAWQIAVRPDGAVPLGGLAPVLLQWPPGVHPAAQRMPDLGVKLLGLTLRAAKPEPLRASLARFGADRLAEIRPMRRGAAMLEAHFVRPDGKEVTIGSGEFVPA